MSAGAAAAGLLVCGWWLVRNYFVYGEPVGFRDVVRFNQFLGDAQEIGQGVVVNQGNWQQQLDDNKNAFMLDFVQRTGFTDAYATTLTLSGEKRAFPGLPR